MSLKGPYKPSIIICPAGAFQVWRREIVTLESLCLDLKVWVGNYDKNLSADRSITVCKDITELWDAIKDLPRDDPNSAKVIFITTYGTFFRRTLNDTRSEKDSAHSKLLSAQAKEVDGEGEDEDSNTVLDEAELNVYMSKVKGIFDYYILDEGYMIKVINMFTYQAIVKAEFRRVLLVTTTTVINKAKDLVSILSIVNTYILSEYRLQAK